MSTVKFNDIFWFAPKSKIKAGDGMEKGRFPFYTSSPILSKYYHTEQHFDEALIFGTGGSASVHYANEPFSTSTDCIVAIRKDQNFNTKFIYYYLFGNLHILERGFKGAGLKHISKKYIQNIDIPVFDLEDQNQIVAILDKASALVEKRQATIDLLDELLRAQFLEMFGDPIANKKNWETKLLGEIANLERGRFSPRPRNDPSYFGGTFPFIQTGDISRANYRLSEYTQTLNEKGIGVSKEFNEGNIVIAIVGATIGATAILKLDCYATDSIIGINSFSGKTYNVFLEMILRFYKQVLIDKAPEAARANINLRILNLLEIIQPPADQQEKYYQISEYIEGKITTLKRSKSELEDLFNSILQSAFSGGLTLSVAIELDSLLETIDLQKPENDLYSILSNEEYVSSLVDRLNNQDFENQDLYDKAKHAAFQLLKADEIITQKYDEESKSLKLVVK